MLSTLPTLWTDSLLSLVVCFTSVRAGRRRVGVGSLAVRACWGKDELTCRPGTKVIAPIFGRLPDTKGLY